MIPYDPDFITNFVIGRVGVELKKAYGLCTPPRIPGDDPGYCDWPMRIMRDIDTGMDPEASLAKHLYGPGELYDSLSITRPFPQPPSRQTLLNGAMMVQGATIHTDQFGDMPWWPACWPWLSPASRAQAAAQLLALGDEITLFQYPDGRPLYDESGQFYSPDKFPAMLWTMDQTAALIEELIGYGFAGVWVFLGGDTSYHESAAQAQELGPVLTTRSVGNLNDYSVVLPGWDGPWSFPPLYTRDQLASFADVCVAAGIKNIGCEHGTGYPLAGKGNADFQPGGVMHKYSLILGEFNDDQWDGSVWEILARYLPPGVYTHPGYLQPANDDPPPYPYYLEGWDGAYRVFEYYIYGAVRGVPNSIIHLARARFQSMGAPHVC